MKLYKMHEIQLGLVILVICFVLLLNSDLNMNISLSHGLIIIISAIFLCVLLLNLIALLKIPHVGHLHILYKTDDYFFNVYKQLFFAIYFVLSTIIIGLIAEAVNDRGQNILLISMLTSSIYYVLISLICTYRFIYQASIAENINFEKENDI